MRRLFFNYYLLVIVIVLLARFVAIPMVELLAAAPFRKDFITYYQELTKGSYFLVSSHLGQYPKNEWTIRLTELESQFGYPLEIVPLESFSATSEEYQELRKGKILVGNRYDQFWRRIGQSDQVLVMGPFPSPGVGRSADILVWGTVLLLVSCVVFFWTVPFWRQIKKINRSTADFGEGDLTARVSVPRRSPLAPLADTFNRMADQIQYLITSHKSLTNAVSHELRTPLFRMRLGMEMLTKAEDESEKKRFTQGIYRDLGEMDTLVSELLTFARFDTGTIELQAEDIELTTWLEQKITELAGEIEAELWLNERSNHAQETLCADPALLYRALGNLVRNAAKYGHGQVMVTAQWNKTEVAIHVDDDGPGIAPEDREQVFEVFTRLDASRSRDLGGYGLGLSIVKQIMTLHRGSVNVSESSLGGSRFTLLFKK